MPDPAGAEGYYFSQVPTKLRGIVAEQAAKDAEQKAAKVKVIFDDFCQRNNVEVTNRPGSGPSADWATATGYVNEVLTRRARLVDVVAMPRPRIRSSAVLRSPAGETLEALIVESGRPILLVPPGWSARRCEHAAFAWNESLEASRALAMVMPWLPQMSAVSVLASRKREASARLLLNYLAWHGVKAEIQWLDNRGKSPKHAIDNVCAEIGADFLVVGGFSRARARQRLFGGVTSHLLSSTNIITVMVH
jgi:nucleotide-binding universal stress UspA family protein